MNTEHTAIIERKFNHDKNNGQISLGVLKLSELPTDFQFGLQPFYSCLIVLDNGIYQPFFKPGDVLQAFPSDYASDLSDPPVSLADIHPGASVFYVRFGSLAFGSLMSAGLMVTDSFFHFNLSSWAANWMEELMDALKTTPDDDLAEVYLNIQKFVVQIHRTVLSAAVRNRQLIESGKQLLFQKCLGDFSLEEVSCSLGLSYESFRKLFKEQTGMSPLQYALDCRFHYAQRCLTEGMSVKETAAHVGYADPYIFSKQFKKYTGFSPNHYKKHP